MRTTAKDLAGYASASVAIMMARRVTSDRDVTHGLDWDSVTAHFLRYPLLAPGGWESAVIAAVNAGQHPDPARSRTCPNYAPLGSGATAAKLAQLRTGRKRAQLEGCYRKLEWPVCGRLPGLRRQGRCGVPVGVTPASAANDQPPFAHLPAAIRTINELVTPVVTLGETVGSVFLIPGPGMYARSARLTNSQGFTSLAAISYPGNS